MPTVTVAPNGEPEEAPPAYDIERALQILRGAQPGPAPVAPAPGFLDRLGAGLANIQAPAGGRGGDAFGANLIAGFGQSFGGNRVAAREAALKAQLDEYERGNALKATEAQARLGALGKEYESKSALALKRAGREPREAKPDTDVTITPGMAKRYPRFRGLEGQKLTRSTFEQVATEKPESPSGGNDIVAIETPDGPRYVRKGDALGKSPAKGSREGNRPPAMAEREHLTGDIDLLRQINDVRAAYKPEYVGPYAGGVRGAVTSKLGGQSTGESKFRGRVSAIRNQILKLRSGGAVTEGEAQRLLEELMVVTDPSGSFESKMDNFEDLVRNMATTRREVFQGTGIDLSRIPGLPASMRAGATATATPTPKPGGHFEKYAPGRK